MNKLWGVLVTAMAVVAIAAAGLIAVADDDDDRRGRGRSFRARMSGSEEVPTLSVSATGSFRLRFNEDRTEATYTLTYSGLTGNALFAHIHLGVRGTNGGVIVFLCEAVANPPVPACPGAGGSVSGTLNAASVVGPRTQGIAPGEWEEFVSAVRSGLTYANVHTPTVGQNAGNPGFPGGEIRGQLSSSSSD